MEPIHFVILAISSWRIASLLVDEPGPFDLFEKIRNRVGIKYDAKSEPYAINGLAKQFLCVWCMSLWCAIVVSVIYIVWADFVYVLLPFSLSGVGMLLDKQLWRGYKRNNHKG